MSTPTSPAPAPPDARPELPPPSAVRLPVVLGVLGHADADLRDSLPSTQRLRLHLRTLFRKLHQNYPNTPLRLLGDLRVGVGSFAREVADEAARDGVPIEPLTPASPLDDAPESLAFLVQHSQILLALWDGEATSDPARWVSYQLEGTPPALRPGESPLAPPTRGPVWHLFTPRQDRPAPEHAGHFRPLLRPTPPADAPRRASFFARLRRGWNWVVARCVWRRRTLGTFARPLDRLEEFNREVHRRNDWLRQRREEDQAELRKKPLPKEGEWNLPLDPGTKVPDEPPAHLLLDRVSDRDQRKAVLDTLTAYQSANYLAMDYQKWTKRSVRCMFVLAWLAAYFKLLYYRVPEAKWATPLAFLFLVASAAILAALWWRGWRRKAQDYRTLAEGARVQLFWRLAGLGACAADHYPFGLRKDLGWVRLALRNACLVADPPPCRGARCDAPAAAGQSHLDLVRWFWVRGQTSYFNRAAPRDHRAYRTLQRWRWLFLVVGSAYLVWQHLRAVLDFLLPRAWAALLPAFPTPFALARDALGLDPAAPEHATALTLLRAADVFLGVGCFLVGSSLYGYSAVLGLRAHAERYRRTQQMYDQAYRYFAEPGWGGRPGTAADDHRRLLELGQEALHENALWLREQRKHDEEMPPT